jgi:hypothetical protein
MSKLGGSFYCWVPSPLWDEWKIGYGSVAVHDSRVNLNKLWLIRQTFNDSYQLHTFGPYSAKDGMRNCVEESARSRGGLTSCPPWLSDLTPMHFFSFVNTWRRTFTQSLQKISKTSWQDLRQLWQWPMPLYYGVFQRMQSALKWTDAASNTFCKRQAPMVWSWQLALSYGDK